MDRVEEFAAIVEREVEWYGSTRAWKAKSYNVTDREKHIYAALDVPDHPRKHPARVIVMARLVGDLVIVDEDRTDRPLYESLVEAGIPREKIILAYAGEAPQETASQE